MISHAHRCIFVHIPKTGGTSLENLIWPAAQHRTPHDLWMGFADRYHNKYQTGGLQHLLASQIRHEIGVETFDSYFKFAIVRNPWDKAVSQFAFMRTREDLQEFIGMRLADPFKRYLELISKKTHVQWMPQTTFIQDEAGTVLVDFVGRYETFATSVQHILTRIGIQPTAIPHEKRGCRGPYQDYYDDESREIVASMYAQDIRAFGYSFEGQTSQLAAAA